MKRRRRTVALTISQKLIALLVLMMIGAVGSVAFYLSMRQLEAMSDDLRTKAETYARVMAPQTVSVVAFSDRETAREVLGSLTSDPDIAAVRLYTSTGAELFAAGEASPWAPKAIRATRLRVVAAGERVASVVPVASLEGPRGTLLIELSTRTQRAERNRVALMAALAGLAVIALGSLAAWLIASRLTRRLRVIAAAASKVADGDLAQQPIAVGAGDEIGVLAAAFNKMLAQLRHLFENLREMAQLDKARLEKLVGERTAQLELRTVEMRQIFDQVDQGLLIVAADGSLADEHSAAVARLLGPPPASKRFPAYVRQFAPSAADWFELMWLSLDDGTLPLEVALAQIPTRFEVDGRHLELSYKPFTDAAGALRILVVITDTSAARERQRAERTERESATLLTRLLQDRRGALAFLSEVNGLLERLRGPCSEADFRRILHTLKGSFSLERLGSLAELAHALETLADESLAAARLRAPDLLAHWSLVSSRMRALVEETSDRADVRTHELAALEDAIARAAPHAELARLVAGWREERVAPRFERFAEHARLVAMKLGKAPFEIRVEVDPELRLPEERWGPFWSVFVHPLHNAVDHGLMRPDEREAAGRSSLGLVRLCARAEDEQIVIEIHDDGRGIDWDAVASSASRLGLPTETHEQLTEALFHDGMSTRTEVSMSSGRGIGMAALRAIVVYSGGTIAVESSPATGTTMRFTWPCPAAPPPPPAPPSPPRVTGRRATASATADVARVTARPASRR